MTSDSGALAALSNEIAAAVERVSRGIVAVEARSRVGSSGFYLRPHLIVTAEHALESDEIEVVHAGGETERAALAGRDPTTDVALLRTERPGEPLALASGDGALRAGTIVLAVARDDDGDVAATMGVLSAVGAAWRTWHGGDIDRFLRPDLSLYPRFSGSPLLDASGAVLGLNTLGLARRQAVTVPASTIERVTGALERGGGRLARGYLGVHLQSLERGAIVLGVAPDSPADRGGLIVGDVIDGIDGHAVETAADVHAQLAGSVGRTMVLELRRGGQPQRVQVTVGARPEEEG